MKQMNAFLIQVLLLFTMLLMSPTMGYAAVMTSAQQVQAVQALEDTLFTVHYDQEALDARLGRIETTVFGQPQTGSADARIGKLQSVMAPSSLGPLSAVSKGPTNAADNRTATNPSQPMTNAAAKPGKPSGKSGNGKNTPVQTQPMGNTPVATNQPYPSTSVPMAGETDYPTVSQMEQKLFGKTFVQEDITLRLTRLEKQVFKTVQTGALADRMDNLRLVVLGDTGAQPTAAMAYNDPSYGPANRAYTSPQGGSYSQIPNGGYGTPQYSSGYPQPPNYGGSGYGGTPIASGQPNYGPPGYPSMGNGGDPMPGYNPAPGGGTYYPSNSYPSSYPASGYPSAQSVPAGEPTPDMLAAMTEVEKEVLGKTYPSEPIGARLDRVETKVFHATSPEMSSDERMQRVIAVASAGGAPQTGKAKAKSTFQTLLPIILTILPMVLL